MTEEDKIDALHKYLNVAYKNDVLLETVYAAFKLQETRGYDIDQAFRESLWSCLLFNAKTPGKERVKDIIEDDK